MAKGTLTRPRPSGREHPSRRKIASKPPAPGRNSKRATGGFFQKKSIEELAAEQGVSLRGQLDRIWGKGWIAATAIEYDCSLVTHDARDFHSIPGLRIITETT
ncbi:MAG: hypothetical protein DMG24_03675 [Acidobacteria bacterium]|nr:MAG: hypothetical protein DMG24_03675 [Acidobacteriota bacterium]